MMHSPLTGGKNPFADMIAKAEKPPRDSFTEKTVAQVHEFYMNGEIEESSEYSEWFNCIRHCTPMDTVKIYLNSYGGDLMTAVQFMRVMRECKGRVIVSVEGACYSAATIILMMADQYEISPHSSFMFHNYSAVIGGKGGEMTSRMDHDKKWSENLLTDVYRNFLTVSEIQSILDNRDLWMDAEEVVRRLTAKGKQIQRDLKKKKAKKEAE